MSASRIFAFRLSPIPPGTGQASPNIDGGLVNLLDPSAVPELEDWTAAS